MRDTGWARNSSSRPASSSLAMDALANMMPAAAKRRGTDELIQAAAQIACWRPEALQAEGPDHRRRKLVDGLADAR